MANNQLAALKQEMDDFNSHVSDELNSYRQRAMLELYEAEKENDHEAINEISDFLALIADQAAATLDIV